MLKKNEAVILGLMVVALSIFVYFKDPFNGPILPCIFNKITGFYCPGCGMTRAVNSCFKFDFYQALRFNALLFIMPITLGAYYLAKHMKKPKIATIILIIMLAIAVGYGILRNIPQFDFLAPISNKYLSLGHLLNSIKS
ncbi:MAG TPA: DUF2752 domain-containing protein [Epulopiscium sp.]|nr:DUF2752 domain-containing protein [Candidatus Epulonipiscium sp.]